MTAEPTTQERLHTDLKKIILASGPGAKLPPEPALAERMGVSRASLREALKTFENHGAIQRIQGSGTFISDIDPILDSGLEVLESIPTMAERSGIPVGLGEWEMISRQATQLEIECLNLAVGSQVNEIQRVMLVNEKPAAYLVDILDAGILAGNDISSTFTGSVLDLVANEKRQVLTRARTNITAIEASGRITRLLGVPKGKAVLYFYAEIFNQENVRTILSESYFLSECFEFHVMRRIR